MVSQSRRYDAGLHAFRALITDNLGGLGILNSDFYIGAHFGGFREEMNSPLILDMAIHTFDAARYLSNADALSVYCDEFNPPWSWFKGSSSALAVFEMTGGVRYSYRGSWCAEGRHTSWDADWRAVGARGTAVWDGTRAPAAEIVDGTTGFLSTFREVVGEPVEGYAAGISGSLQDFLHALKSGTIPMGECHDNIKSLDMVFSAIESAGTGRRVALGH
jgi:predicted dehydrogenase